VHAEVAIDVHGFGKKLGKQLFADCADAGSVAVLYDAIVQSENFVLLGDDVALV